MSLRSIKWAAGAALVVMGAAALTGTAYALSNVLILNGTVNLKNYDGFYQKDYPNYTGPAVVYFNEFTLAPGDASPWHYHEGTAYVVITHGTITEDEGCGRMTTHAAGAGWVEKPHQIHRVVNKSSGTVVGYWSTMYPAKAQALIPAKAPTCK